MSRTLAELRADLEHLAENRCCDLWPECSHVLAAYDAWIDAREERPKIVDPPVSDAKS